jgi:hypothetical protein
MAQLFGVGGRRRQKNKETFRGSDDQPLLLMTLDHTKSVCHVMLMSKEENHGHATNPKTQTIGEKRTLLGKFELRGVVVGTSEAFSFPLVRDSTRVS